MQIGLIIGERDASEMTLELRFGGSILTAARMLEAELISEMTQELGDKVRLMIDGKEYFSGILLAYRKKGKSVFIEAADKGIYLMRNYAFKEYKGTAQSIAAQVCAEFGIETEELAKKSENTRVISTGNKTAYQVIKTAYEGEFGERNFRIDMGEKGLVVKRLGEEEVMMQAEIYSEEDSGSIENIVNRVAILKTNGLREKNFVQNKEEREKYGTFQRTYREKRTRNSIVEAKKLLRGVERTGKILLPANTEIRTGRKLILMDKTGKTTGEFIARSDEHIFRAGSFTTQITF